MPIKVGGWGKLNKMKRNEKKKKFLFLWGAMILAMALFVGCGTENGKDY